MFAKWLLSLVLPLALIAGLGACENNSARPARRRQHGGRRLPRRDRARGLHPRGRGPAGTPASATARWSAVAWARSAVRRSAGPRPIGGRRGPGRRAGRRGRRHRRHRDRPATRPGSGIEVTVQKDDGQSVTSPSATTATSRWATGSASSTTATAWPASSATPAAAATTDLHAGALEWRASERMSERDALGMEWRARPGPI